MIYRQVDSAASKSLPTNVGLLFETSHNTHTQPTMLALCAVGRQPPHGRTTFSAPICTCFCHHACMALSGAYRWGPNERDGRARSGQRSQDTTINAHAPSISPELHVVQRCIQTYTRSLSPSSIHQPQGGGRAQGHARLTRPYATAPITNIHGTVEVAADDGKTKSQRARRFYDTTMATWTKRECVRAQKRRSTTQHTHTLAGEARPP